MLAYLLLVQMCFVCVCVCVYATLTHCLCNDIHIIVFCIHIILIDDHCWFRCVFVTVCVLTVSHQLFVRVVKRLKEDWLPALQ